MSALLGSKSTLIITLACLLPAVSLNAQNILVQPYLQLATPTSIVIMWETDVNTESIVHYGLSETLGSASSGVVLVTLNNTQLHSVTLKGLAPATRYFYKAMTGNWQSAIFDFVTPPLRDSEASFNIVLMSDMQKDGSNPTIFSDLINTSLLPYIDSVYGSPLSEHLQMAVLPGDVVDNGNAYGQWKNDFFDPGQALWRAVPCYPAIGNHEANSQNYFNYYTLPENGTPGYLEHWYYHDYSNVRVISMNTNSGYRIQPQLDWLDSILTISCSDTLIDFVFAEMHHPFKSELWVPGEADYTGELISRMEAFSDTCGKPTIHFFGHTHAYSRGESRDHNHLWVNVASSGGNIDYWGEFTNQDYDEFIISQDEYGFVMVEVTAGANPKFLLKRLSFGDQNNPGGATRTDMITIRKNNSPPSTPYPVFPASGDTVSAVCLTLKADPFADADGDEFGAAQWQISTDSLNFTSPVFDSWKQYANWYNEVDTQANDDLTDIEAFNLPSGQTLYWRVRYRDRSLEWSQWSNSQQFTTRALDTLSTNLIANPGGENGIDSWTTTTGVIESLGPGECTGANPHQGAKYFAVGALCVEYAFASAYQDLNVTDYAMLIDEGTVIANYGGYLSDYGNQDEPSLALQFLNENGEVISGTDTIRYRQNSWALKQSTTDIPMGTRTIRFIIMGTRYSGTDNDSYFDDLFCGLFNGNLGCTYYTYPGPENGRVYVNRNAPANPDGKSWITAYRSPGEALLQSNSDTTIHEIWIANGAYPVSTTADRDTSYFIERAVRIYGAFAGYETGIDQRNPETNVTTLSGEAGDTTLMEDNVYHVITVGNTLDTVLLDGIHICCGFANGIADTLGGGIVIMNNNLEYTVLKNCLLTNNYSSEGSAVYNQGKTLIDSTTIINTVIEGVSRGAILNKGPQAFLKLVNSAIIQSCITCPKVIINKAGATLHIDQTVTIEED